MPNKYLLNGMFEEVSHSTLLTAATPEAAPGPKTPSGSSRCCGLSYTCGRMGGGGGREDDVYWSGGPEANTGPPKQNKYPILTLVLPLLEQGPSHCFCLDGRRQHRPTQNVIGWSPPKLQDNHTGEVVFLSSLYWGGSQCSERLDPLPR